MDQVELTRLLNGLIATWQNELTVKGKAGRAEINQPLLDKQSDALSDKQKASKISTLLTKPRRQGTIENAGSDTAPKWQLAEQ